MVKQPLQENAPTGLADASHNHSDFVVKVSITPDASTVAKPLLFLFTFIRARD